MPSTEEHSRIDRYLLELHGADPYADVYSASETHREAHGADCEVYPSNPLKARLLGTLARATASRRILEIGGGLGYSALWLADGAGAGASVETIDHFPEHVAQIDEFAQRFGLGERVNATEGEGDQVLSELQGPYDFIHDDAWFGKEPPYLARMIELLRPGGTLAISNWFLIEQSIVAEPDTDWSQFAGPDWQQTIRDYAETLASRSDLDLSFIPHPWVALAVRKQ